MTAPKSDTATIEARKNRLLDLLKEGMTQADAAEVLRLEGHPADIRTVRRDVASLRVQWGEENMTQFDQLREQQLQECAEDRAELKSLRVMLEDKLLDPIKAVALAIQIVDKRDKVARREMDLAGTAAPTKSISARLSGPQLDALYLDIRQVLLDLDEADRPEGLQLLQDWAKTKIKPRVLVATKFITEGTDENIS